MVKVQQRGLGRGLSALMGDDDVMEAANESPAKKANKVAANKPVEGLLNVPVSSMVVNRYQPRKHFDETKIAELAKSIKANGIMQPIVVRGSGEFAGKFEIVAGERRFRAAQKLGLKDVPVLLRELSDIQALELALIENIQRQDLNAIEEARGYQRLMEEFSYTQEKLAKSVGKSRSHVANLLRLLALPESVKNHIAAGDLSMGHARALLTAEEPEKLAGAIIAGGLSVREAEKFAKGAQHNVESAARKPREIKPSRTGDERSNNVNKDDDIVALEAMLTENLGLNVEISDRGGQKGHIAIYYETLSELDGILQRLDGNG